MEQLKYVDGQIKGMLVKDEMGGGMKVAAGFEDEYERLKAVRDQLWIDLGILPEAEKGLPWSEGEQQQGPPLPAGYVFGETVDVRGQTAATPDPIGGVNDDPLGIRGSLFKAGMESVR